MRTVDCIGKLIQRNDRTLPVRLKVLDDFHPLFEYFFSRFNNLIGLDDGIQFGLLLFGLHFPAVQIRELRRQARVPPVPAPACSEDDDNRKNRRQTGRHSSLHSDSWLPACSGEIDLNHQSNPRKAKPTATAKAGPRDTTLYESTLGPTLMALNG